MSALQVVTGLTLLLICVLAFAVRLFSVIKYESVIHEFDPYFNYRVTRFLTEVCKPTWPFYMYVRQAGLMWSRSRAYAWQMSERYVSPALGRDVFAP